MKKLVSVLVLTTMLALTCTVYGEESYPTPEFNTTVIYNDVEGMTDDYTYTLEKGTVDVASKESALMVNGEFVPNKGVMRNGTTFVPVRVISESFGKDVKWNEETQQVTIKDDEDIVLTINSTTAKDGTTDVKLAQAPFVEKGVTYVPLRFVAESLDKEVGYVPKSYENAYLHNSIVWVEDKDLMKNAGYEPKEIIKWLKPQIYANKNFFHPVGNEDYFTNEDVEKITYVGQLGRYAVFNSVKPILVDMEHKAVYFYNGGVGFAALFPAVVDGEYYIKELDMAIKLPKEIEGKYYIGEVQYYEDRDLYYFEIYHKGSKDANKDYGLIGTVYQWGKEYSTHNPPIMAGADVDLYSTETYNYMFQTTSDYQGYEPNKKISDEYNVVQRIVCDNKTIRASVRPIESTEIPLDYPYKATNEFFFGTWKVDKFLDFGKAFNDDTEQPNGYDIVGKEVVLEVGNFDTTSFDKYPQFQYKTEYPYYEANSFGFENGDGVDFGTNVNSQVIEVLTSYYGIKGNAQTVFYVIDHERLVMRVGDRTWYELVKVKEPTPDVYERPGINLFPEVYDYGPSFEVAELDDYDKGEFTNTWEVEKLVGFSEITSPRAEYPTGPNIVGKQIVIEDDKFSTMDFEGYEACQVEVSNPVYKRTANYSSKSSLYEYEKIELPGILNEDSITEINVYSKDDQKVVPIAFYTVSYAEFYMVWDGGAIYKLKPVN